MSPFFSHPILVRPTPSQWRHLCILSILVDKGHQPWGYRDKSNVHLELVSLLAGKHPHSMKLLGLIVNPEGHKSFYSICVLDSATWRYVVSTTSRWLEVKWPAPFLLGIYRSDRNAWIYQHDACMYMFHGCAWGGTCECKADWRQRFIFSTWCGLNRIKFMFTRLSFCSFVQVFLKTVILATGWKTFHKLRHHPVSCESQPMYILAHAPLHVVES